MVVLDTDGAETRLQAPSFSQAYAMADDIARNGFWLHLVLTPAHRVHSVTILPPPPPKQ